MKGTGPAQLFAKNNRLAGGFCKPPKHKLTSQLIHEQILKPKFLLKREEQTGESGSELDKGISRFK
jgi:hypothetical protein